MHVVSTDVLRTIQSAKSELHGLYGKSNVEFDADDLEALRNAPKTLSVRNARKLDSELGNQVLPDNFQPIPVFTYKDSNKADYLSENSCEQVQDGDDYYWGRPQTTEKYDKEYLAVLRDPIAKAFKLSEEEKSKLTFGKVYDYCDALFSEHFQGMPARIILNADQQLHCDRTQII